MTKAKSPSRLYRFWRLYVDGFSNLSRMAKILWIIIFVKLFVMFAVLKPFFFPNHTKRQAREHGISGSEWVQHDLIERASKAGGSDSSVTTSPESEVPEHTEAQPEPQPEAQ